MKMKPALCLSLFASVACAVWPLPSSYEHGDTLLWLGKDVVFRWYQVGANNVGPLQSQPHDQEPFIWAPDSNAGFDEQNGSHESHDSHDSNLGLRKRYSALQWPDDHDHDRTGKGPVTGDDIVNYAIKSTWNTLFKHSFYPWKFHTREWKEPAPNKHSTYITHIDIHQLARDPKAISAPLAGQVDESYSLTLSASGSASVSANSSIGIARGLTTLTQLFFAHSSHADNVYTPLAPVSIVDSPKFPHRGINLDVSRNFFPVADIKRQIDAVAYNKMNRLHLHATDSQAWPLEIPALPALARKGAYRPHMVYSAGDFAELQRYAALQGVQLITELDMPGHTSSIHHAFPDLIAAFDVQPNWNDYAAEPPSGTLKLNSTAVDAFLDTLFADLLPRIAPYAAYFHTGGDEVNRNAYTLDDTVKSSDEGVLQPLMQRFVERNHARVRAHGLTPVVWEEMLLEWNVTLGEDVVVQAWQSDEAARQIVERGHKALVGNYKFWYLDCGKGDWLDYPPSSSSSDPSWPYGDYCGPFHNWRQMYSYDPLAGIPASKQHLILGGEAHMWAEQTDGVNVDGSIWPRACAAAEVLWSGAKDAHGRNRSQVEASPRLNDMRERLVARGVRAEPIQMPYCLGVGGDGPLCQVAWDN